MKLEIKRLILKDFLCYKDLDFDFQKYNNLTLICGKNGCGKSGIPEGVVYAIYGKMLRDMPLKEVIRDGATKAVCEIYFSIDNTDYHLIRERYKGKYLFQLNDVTMNSQEQIEYAIKNLPDKEVFQRCFYFGTSAIPPLTTLYQYELKDKLCKFAKLEWLNGCLETLREALNKKLIPLTKIKENQLVYLINQNSSMTEENPKDEDIDKIKKTADIDKNTLKQETAKLEQVKKEIDEYRGKVYELSKEINRTETLLKNDSCPLCLQAIPNVLKAELISVKESNSKEIDNWKNYIVEKNKVQEQIQLYIKYLNTLVESNTNSLTKLTTIKQYICKRKDNNDKDIQHLKEIQQKLLKLLQRFKLWEDLFNWKGIPTRIFKEFVLPFINNRLLFYTSSLFPDYKPELKINIKGEVSFVLDNHRDFKALSTGEKHKINICLGLTIRDFIESSYGLEVNSMFFDEVFDGLDKESVEIFIKNIQTDFQDRKIFAITHREELKPYFQDIIDIKEKGKLYGNTAN